MKKILVLLLSVSMLFALCACSATNESETTTTESTTEKASESTTSSSNPLDNVTVETGDDVTNPDGSVNEVIIGTTKPNVTDNTSSTSQRASVVSPENNTTKSGSFETDIIPIE